MNQPSRSSKFINLSVWCYSDVGSWDITDSITNFNYVTSRTSMIQEISISLNMTSQKLQKTSIGFFKEKYVILVELFDSSQKTVVDTTTFDTSVLRYNGLDISQLNQDSEPNNTHEIAFSIELFNTINEGAFTNYNTILEDTTHKKVFKDVIGQFAKKGVYKFEIDPCDPVVTEELEQFFIPDMRLYSTLPFVMNKGYNKEDIPTACYITHKGLCIYSLDKAKTRKKITTTIYPKRSDVKDFEDVFVTKFEIIRDPSIVLQHGRKIPVFSTSIWKHRYHTPRYADTKLTNPIFLPDLYKDVQSRTYSTDSDIKDTNAIKSFQETVRHISMVKLTLNRWTKFDQLLPMRHLYKLNFTGASFNYLSSEYFIHSASVTVHRDNNEFVGNTELLLQVAEVS